jgi:hypothetical protein
MSTTPKAIDAITSWRPPSLASHAKTATAATWLNAT